MLWAMLFILSALAQGQGFDFALEVAQRSELRCATGVPCGPVVMLTLGDIERPSFCTGTLVGPDLVLTAAHCLPRGIRTAGMSCRGHMAVVWPQNLHVEPTPCAEVVASTNPGRNTLAVDAAVIRLTSPAPRQVHGIPINPQGLPDSMQVTLPAVHGQLPGDGGIIASLQTHHCTMSQNSITLPTYDNDHSPMALATDCAEMVDGTSGSAVIDSHGFIRGVFNSSFEFQRMSRLWEWPVALDSYLVAPAQPAPVAWITNLACQTPVLRALGQPPPRNAEAACAIHLPQAPREMSNSREALGLRIIEELTQAQLTATQGICPRLVVGPDRVPRVTHTPCSDGPQ